MLEITKDKSLQHRRPFRVHGLLLKTNIERHKYSAKRWLVYLTRKDSEASATAMPDVGPGIFRLLCLMANTGFRGAAHETLRASIGVVYTIPRTNTALRGEIAFRLDIGVSSVFARVYLGNTCIATRQLEEVRTETKEGRSARQIIWSLGDSIGYGLYEEYLAAVLALMYTHKSRLPVRLELAVWPSTSKEPEYRIQVKPFVRGVLWEDMEVPFDDESIYSYEINCVLSFLVTGDMIRPARVSPSKS